LRAVSPHFKSDSGEICYEGTDPLQKTDRLRNPSTKQIFVKIALGACQ